jgi:aldehyde:ferredoxin oxidoreductase
MLPEYYELRGWDNQGRPRVETLSRLNLLPAQ